MRSSKIFVSALLLAWGLLLNTSSMAQSNDKIFDNLSDEDQKAIEALVLYPDSIRNAIFIASTEPEIIIRLDALTAYTREEFDDLLGSFEEEDQKHLWELSRYPDLISEMAVNGAKKDLKSITSGYPEEVRIAALKMGVNSPETISRMDELNSMYDQAFEKLLSSYNRDVQGAYWLLLTQPEVLEILSDNIRLTLLVGDNYERDPERIKQQSDSLQAVIAQRNAEELDYWKEELNSNPQAKEELEKAAKNYAEENGYEEEYYEEPQNRTIVVHHYPYWYGHPRWHPYHGWYPYNYYWDWGFYYNGYGNMVIIGLPSYHFSWWFFSNPFWYHHYSFFAHHCLWHHHFYHYHYGYHGMHTAISHWHRDMGISDPAWLANKERGRERIRELGRSELDRSEYNKANPQRPMTREAFIKANSANYPQLSERKENTTKRETNTEKQDRPDPMYVRPDNSKPKTSDVSKNNQKSRENVINQRDYRAPDFHRNMWERGNRTNTNTRSSSKSANTVKRTYNTRKKEGGRRN